MGEEAEKITITVKEKLESCDRIAERIELSLKILRNALKMAIDLANADDELISRQADILVDKLVVASADIIDAARIAHSITGKLLP